MRETDRIPVCGPRPVTQSGVFHISDSAHPRDRSRIDSVIDAIDRSQRDRVGRIENGDFNGQMAAPLETVGRSRER